MDALQEAILRCNVPLKFDNQTEGYGNCFPNAIVQQCRRPEILDWLRVENPAGIFKSPQSLRREIKKFALTHQNISLDNFKSNYNKISCSYA